jgi:hypothetical protein
MFKGSNFHSWAEDFQYWHLVYDRYTDAYDAIAIDESEGWGDWHGFASLADAKAFLTCVS